MEIFITLLSVFTITGIFLFTMDDLFLDIASFINGARPTEITPEELDQLERLPQKRFAILIANWHEENVLERMVQGNLGQIRYKEFSIFLGVYPNDKPTWEAAQRLEKKYSQVIVIVNKLPGPTSKGQMLNEMVRQILASEEHSKMHYDAFLLHDSEDLIHAESLHMLNADLNRADFVQIPVFSLETPYSDFTAGTYADEFAEAHTKNLLTREALGAAIPSAGVGTAISRRLILALGEKMDKNFLNENTLTEDYQLGLTAHRLGFKTHFSCRFIKKDGGRDFIATREFFPDQIGASIRQKTRWTAGIAFQGNKHLGWAGTTIDRYFLWRDRRGPLNGVLIFLCAILLAIYSGHFARLQDFPEIAKTTLFSYLLGINFFQMGWRILLRARATHMVYGLKFALLVPLRWPLANMINTMAAWKAFRSYRASVKNGKAMAWVKTQHRLPSNFGKESRTKLSSKTGASA